MPNCADAEAAGLSGRWAVPQQRAVLQTLGITHRPIKQGRLIQPSAWQTCRSILSTAHEQPRPGPLRTQQRALPGDREVAALSRGTP